MPLSEADERRVTDAVEALFSYNLDPFVRGFVRAQPKPRIRSDLAERLLRQEITQALLATHPEGHRLELARLLDYLDELQQSGNQHIFLLSLPEEKRGELVRIASQLAALASPLSDADPVALHNGHARLAERYNANRWIAESRGGPALAAAFHANRHLLLKWVETRDFFEKCDEEDPETGGRISRQLRREERAVNYFRLDLDSGEAEIKIQQLHTGAQAARLHELEKYRALAAEVTGCGSFVQPPLAPAIRRALSERRDGIGTVTVLLPAGGKWTGNLEKGDECPVDPSEVTAAVSLDFDWQAKRTRVRAELDGRIDEVRVPNPCTPEQLEGVLGQVRQWYRDAVSEPSPASKAVPSAGSAVETEEVVAPVGGAPAADWLLHRILRLLKAALSPGEAAPPPSADGVDEAVREFVAAHKPETEGRAPVGAEEASPPQDAWYSRAAIEQFLRHIKRVAHREDQQYRRETSRLDRDGRMLFWLFFSAAVLALVIVGIGGVLVVVFPGRVAVPTLTALVGLATGGGSLLIHKGHKRLDDRLADLRRRQDGNRRVLDAVHAALAIPDPGRRAEEMTKVATTLRDRVLAS
jgi:hypothetical protein